MRVVSSLEQLAMLPRDRAVNGYGPRTPLRLDIPLVARHALLRAEHALNRLQSRCGCMAGGLAALAALGAGGTALVVAGLGWSWRLPLQLAGLIAAALAAGMAAKWLVLAATRWQFARACRTQHRALLRATFDAAQRE